MFSFFAARFIGWLHRAEGAANGTAIYTTIPEAFIEGEAR
jgi:hypothetical protein